jgi:hypothetical protein
MLGFILVITINLEDSASLPPCIRTRLRACNYYFSGKPFLDEIRQIPEIMSLIVDIDHFCLQNMIVGFHYTRAIREDILTHGLCPRSGDEIRAQFLNRFGDMFSRGEIDAIKAAWKSYFDENARKARDHKVWFNFTRHALTNGDAGRLLKYYGGEQVYSCIDDIPGVAEKLSSIGEAFIVKCALRPSDLRTFIEYPWGSIAVSAYHRSVNSAACQMDQDGSQMVPVSPDRIELIYP